MREVLQLRVGELQCSCCTWELESSRRYATRSWRFVTVKVTFIFSEGPCHPNLLVFPRNLSWVNSCIKLVILVANYAISVVNVMIQFSEPTWTGTRLGNLAPIDRAYPSFGHSGDALRNVSTLISDIIDKLAEILIVSYTSWVCGNFCYRLGPVSYPVVSISGS